MVSWRGGLARRLGRHYVAECGRIGRLLAVTRLRWPTGAANTLFATPCEYATIGPRIGTAILGIGTAILACAASGMPLGSGAVAAAASSGGGVADAFWCGRCVSAAAHDDSIELGELRGEWSAASV